MSGPACDTHWTSASPLGRRRAVWDCALSTMHVEHATVSVLSDSTPALENFIYTSLCRTKYCKRTASISNYDFIR